MDLIRQLAELALASRLRRLADQLQQEVSAIYAEVGVDFEARWFPVLMGLREHGPQPVTTLAERVGLSHQAVSQTLRLLVRRGLVVETRDPDDRRRRQVALGHAGRRLCADLDRVWDQIRAANRDLLDESGVDLLADLERVEQALSRESMAARVRRRLALAPVDPLVIVDYRPAYKKHFRRLNEMWLNDRFVVEPADRRLLDDPNGQILRRGGQVLFALRDGEVAGTCALLRAGADTWELAKMAVDPSHRRRGVGRRLAEAAINRARAQGADRLWLRTSPHLPDAHRLYRALGFRRIEQHPFPDQAYQRETYTMVRDLTPFQERPS